MEVHSIFHLTKPKLLETLRRWIAIAENWRGFRWWWAKMVSLPSFCFRWKALKPQDWTTALRLINCDVRLPRASIYSLIRKNFNLKHPPSWARKLRNCNWIFFLSFRNVIVVYSVPVRFGASRLSLVVAGVLDDRKVKTSEQVKSTISSLFTKNMPEADHDQIKQGNHVWDATILH